MPTVLASIMALLALAALAAWVLAVRISYRIERLRAPDASRRRLFTNIVAGAFGSRASDDAENALRKQLRLRLALALACFIALGALSFALPLTAPTSDVLPVFDVPKDGPYAYPPANAPPTEITDGQPLSGENPAGTTLFYTRSNQDGTKPERILVHIVSPTELHVVKMVAPCKDAAYVTAVFDRAAHEARQLIVGRLQGDGSQLPQAWLAFDPVARKLAVRLGKADARPSQTLDAPPPPWRMYDFELAEFALAGPPPKDGFTFGLALAWPDTTSPVVNNLGEARADLLVGGLASADRSLPNVAAGPYALYTITGAPFGPDGGGVIKLDPVGGHVLNARLDRPNHPGYEDFKLELDAVHRFDGQLAWNKALADHWKDCPA